MKKFLKITLWIIVIYLIFNLIPIPQGELNLSSDGQTSTSVNLFTKLNSIQESSRGFIAMIINGFVDSKDESEKVVPVVYQTQLSGHSRTYSTDKNSNKPYIAINLPSNTKEWYVAFCAHPADVKKPALKLCSGLVGSFGGLFHFWNPSVEKGLGRVSEALYEWSSANGTFDFNMYLIPQNDEALAEATERSSFFEYKGLETWKYRNSGVQRISNHCNGNYYLVFENPDFNDAIYIQVEVCALVELPKSSSN